MDKFLTFEYPPGITAMRRITLGNRTDWVELSREISIPDQEPLIQVIAAIRLSNHYDGEEYYYLIEHYGDWKRRTVTTGTSTHISKL